MLPLEKKQVSAAPSMLADMFVLETTDLLVEDDLPESESGAE
jgi:hypothetical protein